jgi:hypothetical protein
LIKKKNPEISVQIPRKKRKRAIFVRAVVGLLFSDKNI